MGTLIAREYDIKDVVYLSRAREHAFTGIEPSAAGILNFLDFAPLLSNHRPHTRVGDHELNSDGTTAWDRWYVKWLIIYPSHDETKGLADG